MPPARKATVDGSSMAVLTEEIRNLGREFRDWREQVYMPGHERMESAVSGEAITRKEVAEGIADVASGRWTENEKAHEEIIRRLDTLNGFKNKVLGVLSIMGFGAPLGVAVWAIVTRG